MAKKILIVEDDKFLRELIAKKLAKDGFDIAGGRRRRRRNKKG